MRAISKKVQKVMDRIVELLGGKESLKLDNAPEAYMPLSVDRTGDNTFALAHYGEQNGDLMADPDMVFWRGPDGRYYPVSYQNDYMGVCDQAVVGMEEREARRVPPEDSGRYGEVRQRLDEQHCPSAGRIQYPALPGCRRAGRSRHCAASGHRGPGNGIRRRGTGKPHAPARQARPPYCRPDQEEGPRSPPRFSPRRSAKPCPPLRPPDRKTPPAPHGSYPALAPH